MDKDIRFTGYTAVPSDYECTDGEVTQAHNLINEDGAYKSLLAPKVLINLDGKQNVVFIHTTRLIKNFIVMTKDDKGCCTSLKYISEEEPATLVDIDGLPTDEAIVDINAVGNILLISTDTDIHYFYWKVDAYTYLGNALPDIDVRFALQGELTYKLYEKQLITVATGSTNASGDYQAIGQVTWKAYSGQEYENYLESSVKIESGREYRVTQAGLRQIYAANIQYFRVYGTKSGDTSPSLIHQSTSFAFRFTADADYTNIYFVGIVTSNAGITYYSNTATLYVGETSAEGKKIITYDEDGYNAVMAAMNKFVNKEAVESGKFIYPFFVRYGLTMYDGTTVKVSEPILLIPNSGYVPLVNYTSMDTGLRMYAVIASLQYSIKNTIAEEWRELITGISIYVSQPIYPYNQGEAFDSYTNKFKFKFYNSSNTLGGYSSSYARIFLNETVVSDAYCKNDLIGMLVDKFDFGDTTQSADWCICQIAPREQDEIEKDVRSTMTYYKIKEITMDDIKQMDYFADVDMEKGALTSLVAREQLDNSVIPYRNFTHAHLHAYNNRSHLYATAVNLPSPTNIFAQNTYTEPGDEDGEIEGATTYDMFVYVHSEDGDKVLHLNFKDYANAWSNLRWFFYPDRNAYKAVIYRYSEYGEGFAETVTLPLTAHDFIAGAYWYSGGFDTTPPDGGSSEGLTYDKQAEIDAIVEDSSIEKPSVVYVSLPNNPFAYRTVDTVSIGAQKVYGLASAARALSEGQFGQFPLYAFANNGVWAMELSSEGSYEARQPITRDVCSDEGKSITQIDGAVLFATDRGIMEISGSQTQCITDIINGDDFFALDRLPGLAKLYPDGIPQIDCTFADYRKDARMAYDYINQRIIVFNASKSYAYVFSMKSKLWGIVASSLMSAINSYPDAYAMAKVDGSNCLVDLSRSNDTRAKGLLVTRPIKLEAGSMLKTFDTVFLRGLFPKGKVQVALYGSRDNINWHLIHSAKQHYLRGFRGSPYKYFRIVAITDLAVGETLLGASVQYTSRLTNQMR